mmetsp:Transcript_7995/g.13487  ORF Transcript_7995/g.13487 Transcript_7995/m.13487 type:complete len:92 (+) Transcript_7995:621-896(+)
MLYLQFIRLHTEDYLPVQGMEDAIFGGQLPKVLIIGLRGATPAFMGGIVVTLPTGLRQTLNVLFLIALVGVRYYHELGTALKALYRSLYNC